MRVLSLPQLSLFELIKKLQWQEVGRVPPLWENLDCRWLLAHSFSPGKGERSAVAGAGDLRRCSYTACRSARFRPVGLYSVSRRQTFTDITFLTLVFRNVIIVHISQ